MKAPVSAIIAILIGLVVLAGYFIPIEPLVSIRTTLLHWAMILAAFALIAGVLNLVRVHWRKLRSGKAQAFYSAVTLITLLLTVVVTGVFTPTGEWSVWLFNNIQFPIEASLMALLAVILILAVMRLARRRLDAFSVTFLITALLVLLGSVPLLFIGDIPALNIVRNLIMEVPAVAGARGILLGVALGSIAAGVRVLIGADRPYGG